MPGRKIKNPEVKILKIKNPKENLVEIKNPASKPVKIKKPAQKRKRVTKESPSNNEEIFYIKEIMQNYPTKASCHAEVELYKVSWLGYGKRHDSYEPASGIFQDVPLMIKKYWEGKVKDKKLKIKKIKDRKVKTQKVEDQNGEFGNNVDVRTKIVAKRKSKNSEKEEKVENVGKVEEIKKTVPKLGSGAARSTRSSKLTAVFKPTEIPKKLRAFNSSPKIAAQHSQEVKDKMNQGPTGLNRSVRSTRSKKINSPNSEKLLPKNLRPFNLSPTTVSSQKQLATDNNESGINMINDEFNDDLNLSSLSLVDDVFCSTHPSNSPTDQYLSPATTLRCSTSTCSTSELLKTPVLIAPPSCFASPSKSPSESPIGSPIHSLRIVESEVGDECDSEFSQLLEPNTDSSEVNKNEPTKIQINQENQEKIEKNQDSKSNTPERVNKRAKLDNDNTSNENNLVNPGEKSEELNYRRYLYKSMKTKLELSKGEPILEGNCAKCEVELFYVPTVRVNCGHHVCFGCSVKFSVDHDGNCPFCAESAQEVFDALNLKKKKKIDENC